MSHIVSQSPLNSIGEKRKDVHYQSPPTQAKIREEHPNHGISYFEGASWMDFSSAIAHQTIELSVKNKASLKGNNEVLSIALRPTIMPTIIAPAWQRLSS